MLNMKHSIHTDAASTKKLEIQMSWWTMTGLGDPEWSLEERFERIASAGYDGINGFVPAPEDADKWHRLLDQYKLSFSVNAYPHNANDMAEFLTSAKDFGRVQFINAQVMRPFTTNMAAENLIRELNELALMNHIPIFIETHRGTITQDLIRTAQYVDAIDDMRLTIDFSHYVLAGEMRTVSAEAEALLQQLLTRTSSIHARVSNGEQIQVDIGSSGNHPMAEQYKHWWKCGMRQWIQSSEAAIFPFVCELGPAPYAMIANENCADSPELSDRWLQSLVFADIARKIWSELELEIDDKVMSK